MVEYSVKLLALYDMRYHLWFYNAKFRCFFLLPFTLPKDMEQDVLLAKKYSATFHILNKHRISLDEIVSVIVFKINDPPPRRPNTHTKQLFLSTALFLHYMGIWGFTFFPA